MAKKAVWGCGPTDQVRHLYISFDKMWSRACEFPHSQLDTITKSDRVSKCLTCIEVAKDRK